MSEPRQTIRLDKWLWQARFFKTRSLAAKQVAGPGVRVNSDPIHKPARAVGPDDVLTFAQGNRVRVVRIIGLGTRRGPAPEARLLYEDLSPEPAETGAPAGRVGARPTKRDRRQLDAAQRRYGE